MLWPQLAGLKWCPVRCKGVKIDTVQGGVILPEERKVGKISVELFLGPFYSFKHQSV
jgi:hypothetical protein